MYVVSPEFKAAIRTTHEISVRGEVWRGGQRLRSLEILDGSVDVDSRRAQRRTCTVRLAAPKPTINLLPVFNTYQSILGNVVTWDVAISDWNTVGASTWAQGNSTPNSLPPNPYGTYAQLAAGYASYGALQQISGYTEETVDDGLIPQTALSDVAPFGNELRLWSGVKVATPRFRTYASIAGTKVSWDLVDPTLTWSGISGALTWNDGNNVPT